MLNPTSLWLVACIRLPTPILRPSTSFFFKKFALSKKSGFSLENKTLLYNATIKPIWTYGIQLWCTACVTNLNIIQRRQSKTLKTITGSPRYMRNENIHKDLQIPTIKGSTKTTPSSEPFGYFGCFLGLRNKSNAPEEKVLTSLVKSDIEPAA
ncbi:unnamed protein product [Ceratitis capitata]|uniref:(Mediterranean fruit fly) hypothetical protein n=1 Tax=Ceratitis capitata TaxID=7213 RepID=A0A811U632_CERCA|nr:unnamed protein product [Ceratitis capitata]